MKHIALVLVLGVIGGNIVYNSYVIPASQPIVYAAEPEEPRVIQLEVVTNWTEEKIKQKIRDTFPEQPELMVKIAWCESRWKPDAKGPTDDHGIFQLHAPSHDLSAIDVYDPKENIEFARKLYDQNGTRPWTSSKRCWNE